MVQHEPIVSVLMTSYNREKYIAEAIESVLSSTLQDFELIIVDDCSTDGTLGIARNFESMDSRVKVFVNERNLGDYPNRNKAAEYASGKYIKYLDSDDVIYDFGLKTMVEYMCRFPDADFGLCSLSFHEPVPIEISPKQIYLESFLQYNHFGRSPGSSIIKREKFLELGGFSGKRMIGDLEFWLRIAQESKMVKLPYDIHFSRHHHDRESNSEYSLQYPKLQREIIEIALQSVKCPLNEVEKKMIYSKLKKEKTKNILLRLISILIKSWRK